MMPEVVHPEDESLLIARAIRALGPCPVRWREASVQRFCGRDYVVLPIEEEPPVVYRLHLNGELRRMLRPPAELTEGYES